MLVLAQVPLQPSLQRRHFLLQLGQQALLVLHGHSGLTVSKETRFKSCFQPKAEPTSDKMTRYLLLLQLQEVVLSL